MKRATFKGTFRLANIRDFNPRPHEEGDTSFCDSRRNGDYFNPRPHEEGDFTDNTWTANTIYFNPRPHEEGDLLDFLLLRV